MHNKKLYIYQRIGFKMFLLTFYLLVVFSVKANDRFKTEIDSLQNLLLVHSDPQITLPIVSRIVALYEHNPGTATFLKRKFSDAVAIDSIPVIYASLSGLTQYYYNKSDRDSLLYWSGIVDSISKSRNEYPDALFDAKSYVCRDLLWRKNYEMALNDATDIYRLASKLKHTYGLICCVESLGLIYRAVFRDKDAVEFLQEGLNLLNATNGKHETKLRLASSMVGPSLRTGNLDQTATLFENYKKLIEEQVKLNKNAGEVYPIEREYWVFYCYYTIFCLNKKDMYQAKKSFDKANFYSDFPYLEGDFVHVLYIFMQACYYKETENYTQALFYINKLLTLESISEDYKLKADIQIAMGNLQGALVSYDELFKMATESNTETFFRQINQLRTLHEISNKEKQNYELQVSKERIKHKQNQLLLSLFAVFILLVLLYVLYVYFRRAQRLKDELLQEKKALEESEKNLRRETDKIEAANQMKSTFVANMSHEIRTPLNAIVGFSALLTDSSNSPEEREEYTSIIRNNTELMLNLVNDVLDLSRLEAGDMYFNLKCYPLFDCCKMALESIRNRMPEGVELTFTPDSDSVILYTDTLRLQQLLTNLLTNAMKFTEKGEINLSYALDADKKYVRIAVTDTGSGIPLEKQAALFGRFEKLNDNKQGTGLGLSICKTIAQNLSGSISIDLTYTKGARFVFVHPCEIPSSALDK